MKEKILTGLVIEKEKLCIATETLIRDNESKAKNTELGLIFIITIKLFSWRLGGSKKRLWSHEI